MTEYNIDMCVRHVCKTYFAYLVVFIASRLVTVGI